MPAPIIILSEEGVILTLPSNQQHTIRVSDPDQLLTLLTQLPNLAKHAQTIAQMLRVYQATKGDL